MMMEADGTRQEWNSGLCQEHAQKVMNNRGEGKLTINWVTQAQLQNGY